MAIVTLMENVTMPIEITSPINVVIIFMGGKRGIGKLDSLEKKFKKREAK
jgi:hypothetical protein